MCLVCRRRRSLRPTRMLHTLHTRQLRTRVPATDLLPSPRTHAAAAAAPHGSRAPRTWRPRTSTCTWPTGRGPSATCWRAAASTTPCPPTPSSSPCTTPSSLPRTGPSRPRRTPPSWVSGGSDLHTHCCCRWRCGLTRQRRGAGDRAASGCSLRAGNVCCFTRSRACSPSVGVHVPLSGNGYASSPSSPLSSHTHTLRRRHLHCVQPPSPRRAGRCGASATPRRARRALRSRRCVAEAPAPLLRGGICLLVRS
jgi:hypothetical protein